MVEMLPLVPAENVGLFRWIIVAACFTTLCVAPGTLGSFSILYKPFIDTFDSTTSEVGWIMSTSQFSCFITGDVL